MKLDLSGLELAKLPSMALDSVFPMGKTEIFQPTETSCS
jgi:hypothetical protein